MAFWQNWFSRSRDPERKSASSASLNSMGTDAFTTEMMFAEMGGMDRPPENDHIRIRMAEMHPVVMSCTRRIAWSTAAVKIGVKALNGDVMLDHPISQLLEEPNCPGGRWSLISLIAASLALTGRAYVYAPVSAFPGKLPPSLAFLAPQKVNRLTNSEGQIQEYRYNASNGTAGAIELPPSDVIEIRHHWLTDPDDVFGRTMVDRVAYSQMVPAWSPMQLFAGITDLVNKLLKNNGGLPGILSIESGKDGQMLSKDQQAGFAEYMKRFRQDGDRFGSIAFIDTAGGKVNFTRINEDFKTINSDNTKEKAMKEICAIMGVPPLLLGMGADATYSNQAEARRYFWLDTILPGYVEPICDALGQYFGVRLAPDTSDVPALADYNLNLAATIDLIQCMTMNEKRAKLGLPAIMGGDIVMVSPAFQPLNRILDTNGNNLSDETDFWVANQESIRTSLQTGAPVVLPGQQTMRALPAPAPGNPNAQGGAKMFTNVVPLTLEVEKYRAELKRRATTPEPVKKRTYASSKYR